MDLFELLFIALFVLFPIMEQVLKRKKGSGPEEPGPDPMETREGEVSPRSEDRKPVKAADMVPDDLWAVLPGEQRPPTTAGEAPKAPEGVGSEGGAGEPEVPWRSERKDPVEPTESETEETPRWEDAWTPRPDPAWSAEEEGRAPAPVSLEYVGPEAYSLEELDYEPVKRTVPSPEARHRRFHERIESAPTPKRARKSATGRALSRPGTLRQAFILTEVLGTPRGLE